MKLSSIGPQHLCKKCKAGEGPRQTGLGANCGTDELGQVSPGAALFTDPAIKYLHGLPDDLWCLLSYLRAPGR